MRAIFPYALVAGNIDSRRKEFHAENFYDILGFANQPELRDSMGLIHRYSLKPFMIPHRFFYPRVVIDFYQTMTSRGERHHTDLHFTIDGQHGVLRAVDIAIDFQLLVALYNSVDFRQWPNPSP